MLEHVELYINAQKTIANYMTGFGVIMVLLAIVVHFAGINSLFYGLKIGCLVLGLFSVTSGYAYKLMQQNFLEKQISLHHKNPAEFKTVEKERMQKTAKNISLIRTAFVIVIISSLTVVLLNKNNFVNGLLFSLIILLVGNTLIETISKISIDMYYEQVSNF